VSVAEFGRWALDSIDSGLLGVLRERGVGLPHLLAHSLVTIGRCAPLEVTRLCSIF
jgi:hypothetical protein